MKIRTIYTLAALCVFANGCAMFKADRIHYSWFDASVDAVIAPAMTEPAADRDEAFSPMQDVFVGVGLSGGGARASVFGATALEVLAETGILAQVSHISSVSGGGFPAAYYVLNKPEPCAAQDIEINADCQSAEFAEFKQTMRHNFLNDMTLRQFMKPNRLTSPTRRVTSLQEALDDKFVGGANFEDLPPSPVLLINGARYDDGRRFVFSNEIIAEDSSDIAPFTEDVLRTASFSLQGCDRATPAEFPVALALAVSAGFPPLLGPISLEMPKTCEGDGVQYWHLGDGGILDNTGVDTLMDFALHAQSPQRPGTAILFSVDAGRSTAADIMMQQRNLKLWTSDPGRVVDIVGMRANGYRAALLDRVSEEKPVTFHVISMKYTDAQIDAWPASCGARAGGAEAIKAHIANIPTNFKITDCDADLIEAAAKDIVRRRLSENRSNLEAAGLSFD